MTAYNEQCIYDIGPTNNIIEIVEFAPHIFSKIRK